MTKRKISTERKIEAVEKYLRGETTLLLASQELGIGLSTFHEWISKYQTFGLDGLRARGKQFLYTPETMHAAVEEYLKKQYSQDEICRKYRIKDRKTLRRWIKVYNSHKELRPSSGRGSGFYMTKGRNTTYEERVEIVSYCIEHNNDYTSTMEKFGVSYQQIYSWVRKYNDKGAEGLLDKRGKRKPESEMTELERLRAENRMLEARNKRLETENAVLKKLEEIERRWR